MRAPCAFWERLRRANGKEEGSPSGGGGLTGLAIPPLRLRLLP